MDGVTLPSQKEAFPSYFPETCAKNSAGAPRFDASKEEFEKLYGLGFESGRTIPVHEAPQKGTFTLENSLSMLAEKSRFARFILGIIEKHLYFENRDKPKDDPAVKIVIQAIKENPLESLISTSNGSLSPKIVRFIVKKANGRKTRKN